MIHKATFYIMFSVIVTQVNAQEVEHNYRVGPNNATCDSIQIPPGNLPTALDMLKEATYRYINKFRMTRKTGLQGGEFLSCNGTIGFLIVRMDSTEVLYIDVDKSIWEAFTTSSNPEGYYIDNHQQWKIYE